MSIRQEPRHAQPDHGAQSSSLPLREHGRGRGHGHAHSHDSILPTLSHANTSQVSNAAARDADTNAHKRPAARDEESVPLLGTPSSDLEGGPSLYYGTPSSTHRPSFSSTRSHPHHATNVQEASGDATRNSSLTLMGSLLLWPRTLSHARKPSCGSGQNGESLGPSSISRGGEGKGKGKGVLTTMKRGSRAALESVKRAALTATTKHYAKDVGATALRSLPAVLLGMLLNILDGVSCECPLH